MDPKGPDWQPAEAKPVSVPVNLHKEELFRKYMHPNGFFSRMVDLPERLEGLGRMEGRL